MTTSAGRSSAVRWWNIYKWIYTQHKAAKNTTGSNLQYREQSRGNCFPRNLHLQVIQLGSFNSRKRWCLCDSFIVSIVVYSTGRQQGDKQHLYTFISSYSTANFWQLKTISFFGKRLVIVQDLQISLINDIRSKKLLLLKFGKRKTNFWATSHSSMQKTRSSGVKKSACGCAEAPHSIIRAQSGGERLSRTARMQRASAEVCTACCINYTWIIHKLHVCCERRNKWRSFLNKDSAT